MKRDWVLAPFIGRALPWIASVLAIAAWTALVVAYRASSDYSCREMYSGIPDPGNAALVISVLFGIPAFVASLICQAKLPGTLLSRITFIACAVGVSATLVRALSMIGC